MDESEADKGASEAEIIQRMLAENGIDAEEALGGLIAALVRDHLKMRAEKQSTAINLPTVLWQVEKMIWEQRDLHPGNATTPRKVPADDELLGALSLLLITLRERAEDRAAAEEKTKPPMMRLVRD